MIPLEGKSQIIRSDEKLVVCRKTKVYYKDGRPDVFDTIRFFIRCNVQPLSGKDLLLVPEGDRFKEQYWIWVGNASIESSLLANDRVIREEVNFQVQSVENWGSYTKARIMRIDVGPSSVGNNKEEV